MQNANNLKNGSIIISMIFKIQRINDRTMVLKIKLTEDFSIKNN